MRVTPPFHKTFAVYTRTDAPVFYTPSHYLLSMIILTFAMAPLYVMATAFWGWKIIYLLGTSVAAGFVLEGACFHITRQYTGYMGYATWLLFPLMTTPGMSIFLSIPCLLAAIIVTQIFFGGYGRQMFHPAVVAQVFIMNNFIARFSSSLLRPFLEPGYGFYMYTSASKAGESLLGMLKAGKNIGFMQLLKGPHIGFYSDAFPLVLTICGIAFLLLGGINRKTPVAFLLSLSGSAFLLHFLFPGKILPVEYQVFAGSTLFYAFFIFSDRWTSAKSKGGRIIAGIIAGILAVLMRSFSSNADGVMFAALFNYAFTPLYDELCFYLKKKLRKSVP